MNTFMNELYNAVGKEVSGYWNGEAFLGKIVSTRVKYGTDIGLTVEDGNDIYIIDGTTMLNGGDLNYSNLHVYF
jgi:hypothetical protein